jgi:hypothetical protein
MVTALAGVATSANGHGNGNNTDLARATTCGVRTASRHMLKELQHGYDNSHIIDVARTRNLGVLTISTRMNQNKNKNMTSDECKVDDCNSELV